MLVPRILVPDDAKGAAMEGAVTTPQYRRALEETAPLRGSQQGVAVPRLMLVPRILVPVDAKAPPMESAIKTPQYGRTLKAAAVPRGSRQGVAVPRPPLFAQAMLENSPTKPRGRAKDLFVSVTAHGILLAALFLVPIYFTEAIDLHQFNRTLLVAPPPPAPPPSPASAAVARPPATWKKVLPTAGKLVAPKVIPNQIARSEESGGTDLAAEIAPGVPGGVPGGQLGGVIGGILSGASASYLPRPPADSAPKSPIRVGGEVKAPRLVFRVDPVYPSLLQRARVVGDVVIDAVIDPQGNVAEMQPVSGHRLLIPAALDALRHWKYEPTILNGQAVPVELTVTITFRLKSPSPLGSARDAAGE